MSCELSVKNHKTRVEFFSGRSVFAFSMATSLFLIAIFPGFTLKRMISLPHRPSELSVYYLGEISQAAPEEFSWRYSLIQEQLEIGQWEEAKQQIALLNHYKNQEKIAEFLNWELSVREAFAMRDMQKKKMQYQVLKKQLPKFLYMQLSPYFLWRVGESALELGDENIAQHFLEKANLIEPLRDPNDSMAMGKRALGAGAYRISARFYFLAAEQAGDYLIKRKAMQLGLLSLQQGGYQTQGLPIIKKLNKQYLSDRDFLMFLSQYALSAGEPGLASEYIKKALLWHGEAK